LITKRKRTAESVVCAFQERKVINMCFFDDLRDEDLYGPYKPPQIPSGFPVEIGIELYNIDTSNKKAVEEVMEKYKLNNNPDPQLRLTTEEFINTLNSKIIPMTNKAIVGDEPDPEDLSTLEFHLLEGSEKER